MVNKDIRDTSWMQTFLQTICNEPMPRVLEVIGPMMNALRMVWIISRYYSDDSHMGALMERIAIQVCFTFDIMQFLSNIAVTDISSVLG
jgi:hypothetical protein